MTLSKLKPILVHYSYIRVLTHWIIFNEKYYKMSTDCKHVQITLFNIYLIRPSMMDSLQQDRVHNL